jgi:hypothetical protein
MSDSVFLGEMLTERSLMESVLSGHYIIDYGFIKKVNADGTVDVTHAKHLKTLAGKTLPATVTTGVEMLTVSGTGFSLKFDYKKGDRVLLLGLKNFIQKVGEVTSATETTAYLHYSRETLKALPLCVFNGEAKVKVEVEAGTLKVTTDKNIELNGNSKQFVTWAELNQALQGLVNALNSHTHSNGNQGSPTGGPIVSLSLDISSSKTKTILTGG